ncbi:hypothetical protein [Streptomyces sp. NPDC091268]|uniref:hypothetical protein n=1 Tax=Streptomyces sp. NPDC091268 TaxID=3365979 RepID=UPI00380A29A0
MKFRIRELRKLAMGATAGLLAFAAALLPAQGAQAAGSWQFVQQPIPGGYSTGGATILPFSATSAVLTEHEGPCGIGGCWLPEYVWTWNGSTTTAQRASHGYDYPEGRTAGTAPDDLWSFGYPGGIANGGVEHWNGSAWTTYSFPATFSGGSDSIAVTRGEVLTIGTDSTTSVGRPAVGRWAGGAWKVTVLPSPAGKNVDLDAIHQAGPNDIWVVGETQMGQGVTEMYVARYNGTTWTQVPAPALNAPYDLVRQQIAGTSTDLWITGKKTKDGCFTSLRFNGTTWTTVPTCDGTAISSVVKYGATWIANGGSTGLRKWTGTAWSPLPSPRTTSTAVTRFTAEPGGAGFWTVGRDATGLFVSRFTGTL